MWHIKPLYSLAIPTGAKIIMPTAFTQFYKKCCIIIDCTEIFIKQLTNLMDMAKMIYFLKIQYKAQFNMEFTECPSNITMKPSEEDQKFIKIMDDQ